MSIIATDYKRTAGSIAVGTLTAIMLIALLAPAASGAADKAKLKTSPTVKQNTRMKFTFKVTNGSGENVENVLIRPPESSFTEAIGGSENVASLMDAADNLDNASVPLDKASENLGLAADNLSTATSAFSNVAGHLGSAADRIGTYGKDNQDEVSGYLWQAKFELEDASSAFDGGDFSAAADNLDLAGRSLENAGAVSTATGADDPLENAGAKLVDAAGQLKNGNLDAFATQLDSAAGYLQDSADAYDATGKTLLEIASSNMDDAIEDLETAQAGFADAGSYLADAGTNLISASDLLFSAGNDISSVSNLDLAGYGVIDAEKSLAEAGSLLKAPTQAMYSAGKALVASSDSMEKSAKELGEDLGEQSMSAAATAEEAAGDNLATKTSVNLATASEEIASVASNLSSASDKIASTADELGPADWKLYEGSEVGMRSNAVIFRGIADNAIAPGASESFTYLWKTPKTQTRKEYDLGVWVYRGGGWNRISTVEVTVEGKKPTVDITVTQEGVKANGLVGDVYQDGTAMVTIEASETLKSLGDVTIIDNDSGENLLPPLSLATPDNITYTGSFKVGQWDDNATAIKVASATDPYGNKMAEAAKKGFTVDTRAPVIVESGIGMSALGLEEKSLAGTDKVYNVDNEAVHKITGNVEDNFAGTVSVAGKTYDNNDNYVRQIFVEWDGASVRAEEVLTRESAFKKEITLDTNEPLTLKVRSVDWTGNEATSAIENVFIDNRAPEVSFDSLSGDVGTQVWNSAEEPIADNTPKVSLTVSDGGLGVAREDLKVYLDSNDNVYDGTMMTLENMESYSWDAQAGQETFENVIDNAGSGLTDGVYWINVVASDNIEHDGSENVVKSKSFEIYTGSVTAPENVEPSGFTGDTTPTFEWSVDNHRTIVSYGLVVDDSPDYSSPVVDTTVENAAKTSFTPQTALERGKYFVKVTANYDTGQSASTENTFNIGAAEVELKEGWNMVSLPVMPENKDIEAVLDDVKGKVLKVWAYDAEAGEWHTYLPGKPEASDLTKMETGKGYWIEMASPATLKVSGRTLPKPGGVMPVTKLYKGWNLIGYKGTEKMTRKEYLGDTIEGLTASMYEYDPDSNTFNPVGPDEYLEPGQAYWIAVTESAVLYP